MGSNRKYAGPHEAAEVMVDDGVYVCVVRDGLGDDVVRSLGYTFDADDAVQSGRAFAVKSIAVSDELGLKLDRATFPVLDEQGRETGEVQPSWPGIGGTVGEVVDTPATNPATKNVTLDDGTVLTSAEVDERAYTAAAADEVLEAASEAAVNAAGNTGNSADLARERIGQVDARIEAIDDALELGIVEEDDVERDLTKSEVEALNAERKSLVDERANIEKALDAEGAR